MLKMRLGREHNERLNVDVTPTHTSIFITPQLARYLDACYAHPHAFQASTSSVRRKMKFEL